MSPQTTLLGLYMAQSSSHMITPPTHNLNQPPPVTTTWLYPQPTVTVTQTATTQSVSPAISQNSTIPSNPVSFPPITTAEQLATPLPTVVSTSAETLVATTRASQHVVPVSQDFSTILADLHPSQPLRFAVGSSANPAPNTARVRKFKPQRPDCLNAAEFRRMLKRTRNLAKSLEEETVEEAGDAQRTRLEP
uniref:Uncharacterized protein n=1 Tax=Cannabis sativa TaxID=3483 RepID=A0A803QFQ8_CANSA